MITCLQDSEVTQTVLGGQAIHPPVANVSAVCVCQKIMKVGLQETNLLHNEKGAVLDHIVVLIQSGYLGTYL